MRLGSLSAAAIMLAVSTLIWLAAGPDWTLRQVRTALETGDRAALSALIDSAALGDSLRDGTAGKDAPAPRAATVSADGVVRLLTGIGAPDRLRIVQRGLWAFRARADGDAAPVGLIFRRDGASWRLTGIEAPPPGS